MTDFDPNDDLDTQEAADAYVNWCAEQFMRVWASGNRTYRSAWRSSAWLLVVACAQLHLDDDVEQDREALLEQLSKYQALARAIERQQISFPTEQFVVMRSSLDCWEATGCFAEPLLIAARCAISARVLIDLYPLADLWELDCEDVWTLLDNGRDRLAAISDSYSELQFADMAVCRNEPVVAKYTWQKVNNITRGAGLRVDLSGN